MKYSPKNTTQLFPEECLIREITGKPRLSIGIPKENHAVETRLPLTPEGVSIIVEEGHSVYVQRGAGNAIHYSDMQFSEVGAHLVDTEEEIFSTDIIFKIAPPSVKEIEMMHNGASIFSVLQLSNLSREVITLMIKKRITAVAYELIKDNQNTFPILSSISDIEGNAAIATISDLMSSERGGKGILFGGVAGITPPEVVILGAGMSGIVAARAATGLGAFVKVFDHDINKLRKIQQDLGRHIFTSVIHPTVLIKALASADAVIGNLRYINDSEQFMVAEELVKKMKDKTIIVDLSIDQGGCFETSECRTLSNPIYEKHGIIHYCVPNISARVGRTTSMALSNIITPIVLKIGVSGSVQQAIADSLGFRHGAYLYKGIMVNRLIASHYNLSFNEIGLLLTGY